MRYVRLRILLLGALVGAVVMLVALPASRPFYVGTVVPSSLDRALAATAAVAKGSRLPNSRSLSGQAMWFSVAAGRILNGRAISSKELETVQSLMADAGIAEPQNAFWMQADATLLARMGHTDAAVAAWLSGAKRLTWNDHQNDYLGGTFAGRRSVPAYAYAELYELRTPNAAPDWLQNQPSGVRLIWRASRSLLSSTWERPGTNIQMRMATVQNGTLVRQHARSIAAMRAGTDIIESAVSKPSDEPAPSQHHLLIAREKFYNAVAAAGLGYDHDAVEELFKEADAANALTTIEDVRETMRIEAAESAILHTTPGAVLLCASLGAAMLGIRWMLRRLIGSDTKHSWLQTICAAIVAVVVALFLTSAYAAFALGLCIVFAGSTPAHVRKRRPTWLGPLFWVMTSCVTTALLLAGAMGLMLAAEPSRVLLVPKLPAAFDGQAAVCGVAVLAFGFLFLCAPLWAFAQRLPTTYVLDVGLGQIGQKLVLGSLLLAVVTGPTCVYLDKFLVEHRLDQQFRSEPNYYLLPNIKPSDTPTP